MGNLRVGLLSDTHGMLRPEALGFLIGCDYILHGGDVGDPGILDQLGAIAPVIAVRGNNDKGTWAERQAPGLGGRARHLARRRRCAHRTPR